MYIGPEEAGGIVTAFLIIVSVVKSIFDFMTKRNQNKDAIKALQDENLELKIENENKEHDYRLLQEEIKLLRTKCKMVHEAGLKWKERALRCEEESGP